MANEAVLASGDYEFATMTCAAGNSIEKGTLLSLVDPNTVSGAYIADAPFAGIAAMEKSVSDGDTSTKISVIKRGVCDLTAVAAFGPEGAIQAGDLVQLSGVNLIKRISGTLLFAGNAQALSRVVGVALETASAGEVIAVRVGAFT